MQGNLRKMKTQPGPPVEYRLPIGEQEVAVNALLGKTVRLSFSGEIHCVACGRKTRKSFNQGYCYPCFQSLAQCDLCIVKPELCHYEQGTCREPAWGEAHCMQPHYVYIANSSDLKVGITRGSQIPTRWMDQGAVQALPIFRVQSRYQAGLLEVMFKAHLTDRTNWQRMLKGEPEPADLAAKRDELLGLCQAELSNHTQAAGEGAPTLLEEASSYAFTYPVLEYPTKVKSRNFEKTPEVEGTLLGIKGAVSHIRYRRAERAQVRRVCGAVRVARLFGLKSEGFCRGLFSQDLDAGLGAGNVLFDRPTPDADASHDFAVDGNGQPATNYGGSLKMGQAH